MGFLLCARDGREDGRDGSGVWVCVCGGGGVRGGTVRLKGRKVAEFREKSILSLACGWDFHKSLTASGRVSALGGTARQSAVGFNQNRASLF